MLKKSLLSLVVVASACADPEIPPVPEAEAVAEPNSLQGRFLEARAGELGRAPAEALPAPESAAVIAPPAGARVLRVWTAAGDEVKAGDPVLEVLIPEAAVAAGELVAAETRIATYEQRGQQLDALDEIGLARRGDRWSAEVELAEARAAQAAARARLLAVGVAPKEARAVLGRRGAVSLRAPVDGVVVEVDAKIGARDARVEIQGGPAARVVALLPAEAAGGLAHLRFDFEAPGTAAPLTLIRAAPAAEGGSVRAWFSSSAEIPAGLHGVVRIAPKDAGLVVLPAAAVVDGQVRVRAGGRAEARPVEVVARVGARRLVRGLAAGAEVLVEEKGAEGGAS